MLIIFMFTGHLHFIFWELFIHLPIYLIIYWIFLSLYSLEDINPLSDIYLADYLPPTLCRLLTVSFEVQKWLNFKRVCLPMSALFLIQKALACVYIWWFFLSFPSNCFRVAGLALRPLTRLDFIFLQCEKWGFGFTLLGVDALFSQHSSLKPLFP